MEQEPKTTREHRIFGAPTTGRARSQSGASPAVGRAALDRIPPQLEHPQNPRRLSRRGRGIHSPTQRLGEAHEGVQQRPWWRRMFGG